LLETALVVRGGVGVIAARHDYAFWSRCEDEKPVPLRDMEGNSPRAAESA
jgi:hypothetical protein